MSGRSARAAVVVATALLPRPARDRWREELLAELDALPADERGRFARSVLLRALPLRWATAGVPAEPFAASPWACRVRLGHRLHAFSTDDGGRYQRCTRCGWERVPARAVALPTVPWSGVS